MKAHVILGIAAPLVALVASASALTKTPVEPAKPVAAPAAPEAPMTEQGDRVHFAANAGATLTDSDGSARTVRSLIRVPKAMKYGDFIWNDEGVPAGEMWVRVDLASQTLSVFRGGHEIGTAVILFGADEKPTPKGTYPILAKIKDHRSSIYDAPMPFTLRLTGDGISVHASDVRYGRATHGCVGIPKAFAAKLFGAVSVGDEVSLV